VATTICAKAMFTLFLDYLQLCINEYDEGVIDDLLPNSQDYCPGIYDVINEELSKTANYATQLKLLLEYNANVLKAFNERQKPPKQ
jgi:hypothetical protein